ncbi:NAD(P)H-dependent oxidoreductase [uncultured Clostridium sp.]|jgi:hypothetical protein|uniref:NAD(P)H-dependent oxidoreductase n=1 Tax=uncultured Clostridium sp. TaxID=59620 RepID=UPI00261CE84D|nr:NAD(P)H-dependent oxidoreductase [uncultured Clostridium sp.]
MQKILMLNLSPKGKNSNSMLMLNYLKEKFNEKEDTQKFELSIKTLREFGKDREKLLKIMNEVDDVIFAAPLYVDTLPSYVIEFLDYLSDNFKPTKAVNLYGVINCGFLEPYYNLPALNILENFADEIGVNWRCGLGLGAGGFLGGSKDNIPLEARVKSDVNFALNSFTESFFSTAALNDKNITATARMPKRLYGLVADHSFKKLAKENKVKIKDKPHCN